MPNTLAAKSCTPCRGGIPPLTIEEAQGYLAQAPGWDLLDDGHGLPADQEDQRFARERLHHGGKARRSVVALAHSPHPKVRITPSSPAD